MYACVANGFVNLMACVCLRNWAETMLDGVVDVMGGIAVSFFTFFVSYALSF